VVFLLALGGMIFVHEFGHFVAARLFKIEVEEFGLGLPSYRLATLFKWQGTEFTIHALPLGGFVRPKGENDPNVPGGLAAASPWKRLAVLFSGPFMNLLTAILVFSLLIGLQGVPVSGPIRIDTITPGSPAEQAGLLAGDMIVAINGKPIADVDQAITIIQANLDQSVGIEIKRGSERMLLNATPFSSRTQQEGALGVGLMSNTRPAKIGEIVTGGLTITALQAAAIVYLPVAIIQGIIAPADARVIGFKGIFDMFNVAVREDVQSRQGAAGSASQRPTNWTLNLIGLLSISLGVMNLLPIPALDGGRMLFTLPEIVIRRRIPPEMENVINGLAMMLLIALLLFVNLMDFINPAKIPIP
jgi:regulator of sigma E protease